MPPRNDYLLAFRQTSREVWPPPCLREATVNISMFFWIIGSLVTFIHTGKGLGVSYGAPGIGSGEPYNMQLALKIIF